MPGSSSQRHLRLGDGRRIPPPPPLLLLLLLALPVSSPMRASEEPAGGEEDALGKPKWMRLGQGLGAGHS